MTVETDGHTLGSAMSHAEQMAKNDPKKRAAAMAAAFDLWALHDRARADLFRRRADLWRRRINNPEIED